jgi:transposase-like protein
MQQPRQSVSAVKRRASHGRETDANILVYAVTVTVTDAAPHAVGVCHFKGKVAVSSTCRWLVQLVGLRQRLLPVHQRTCAATETAVGFKHTSCGSAALCQPLKWLTYLCNLRSAGLSSNALLNTCGCG